MSRRASAHHRRRLGGCQHPAARCGQPHCVPTRRDGPSRDHGRRAGRDGARRRKGTHLTATQALGDAESSYRTHLAAERTWLAWWRTALAAAAAGLAVGRLLPEVTAGTTWPYVVLGSGYAVVAVALMLAGGFRQARVRAALREGSFHELDDRLLAAFTGVGALLMAATLAVVVVGT